MTDDERPTAAEEEAIQRQCLLAARNVLRQLCINDKLERQTVTVTILKAMRAVHDAWNTASIKGADVDTAHVVATALWEQLLGIDGDDGKETHPYSVGGLVIEGYSRAARLLEAYNYFENNLDDAWDWGTPTDHATKLLAELGDDGEKEPC